MAVGAFQRVLAGSSNFTIGSRRVEFRQVQLTSGANYSSGELINPALVGMKHIEFALPTGPATSFSNGDSCYVVKFHSQAGGTQRFNVYQVGASPGVLPEVAANTDLSLYFIQVAFVGW